MNKRIRSKVYKRANDKLKRQYIPLTTLERKVYRMEQAKFDRLIDGIIDELKGEGDW